MSSSVWFRLYIFNFGICNEFVNIDDPENQSFPLRAEHINTIKANGSMKVG